MEGSSGREPAAAAAQVSRLSRRDLLRLAALTGAAATVPLGLAGCKVAPTPLPLPPDPSLRARGFVGGSDTDVGPGGWCWFQSPRSAMGPNGVLWLGSSIGPGTSASGWVQVTAFDTRTKHVLVKRTVAKGNPDDHSSPAVMPFGDQVQVAWAMHEPWDFLDVGDTSVGGTFVVHRIHRSGSIVPPARGMSYCSTHVVGGVRWLLYRGEEWSWNLLTSADGITWTPHGLVIKPAVSSYRPYLHAASDGKRLAILVTDGHPTEYRGTSTYAGTIEADLTIRRSDGTTVGSVGSGAPRPGHLTSVAIGAAGSDEASDTDLWLSDLRIVDHRPTALLSRRDRWPVRPASVGQYRHQYLWARLRSTGWVVESLCWAGGELSSTQPDYAGLAAQDPTEPTRVVVATNVHPVTGVPLLSTADGRVHFELFEGRRVGEGQWSFTPVTQNSTQDNVRPHIAAAGTAKTLTWMRGRYTTWKDFDTRMVVRSAVPG